MTGREIKEAIISKMAKNIEKLNDDEEYLDCVEFADMYGYQPNSIRQMLKRDQISKAVKVGNQWFISENADILVRQYAKKNKCIL